jgi:sarcosine oxidase
MKRYDVIVLGLGGIGSGAAYWAAKRGQRVLGIEQFQIGHDRGESQDHSRIIRHSYHTPAYVQLTRRAYDAWAQLEADCGERLIVKCGGLDLSPRTGSAIDIEDYARSMDVCGIEYERLDAREIMRRWPQFALGDDIHGLFQVDGGIAPAARCNAAHIRMARSFGATLIEGAPVTHIDDRGGEIIVDAGGHRYTAGRLIIAAGPWTNAALAHFGMHLPLAVTREQVIYYKASRLEDFAPERFPVWIWLDEPCYYGFPAFGEAAVKVAQDFGGYETTADARTFEPDAANLARVSEFVARVLPGAAGSVHRVKTCLYTLTPDRDFVLDTLPDHPTVSLAIGAGHAFKFASELGRALTQLAFDGAAEADLAAFKSNRAILTMADPPRNYMV